MKYNYHKPIIKSATLDINKPASVLHITNVLQHNLLVQVASLVISNYFQKYIRTSGPAIIPKYTFNLLLWHSRHAGYPCVIISFNKYHNTKID